MTDHSTRELARAAARLELQSQVHLANAQALLLCLRAKTRRKP